MAVLTPDQEGVVEAISRDAMATLRVDREADLVSSLSTQARALLDLHGTSSIDRFTQRLVDDFQQRMHDEFIDVSWPRCPRHPNHPLWLIEGIWRCTKDDVAVARLGELPSQE